MRVRVISCIILLVAGIILCRLIYVQLLHGDEYAIIADRQYARAPSNEFSRGTIFFEEKDGGRVSAATLEDIYYLVLNPTQIDGPERLYGVLQEHLTVSKESFIARATKRQDTYEVVEKNLGADDAAAITRVHEPGVTVYTEKKRYYPGGSLGSTFLGFVGKTSESGDAAIGRAGLEAYFDDVLTRHAGGLYVNFFAEIFSNISSVFSDGGDRLDGDIVTTIEPTVQRELEKVLKSTEALWHADRLGGVILDPLTGKIIAMAGYPNFDPNTYNTVKDPHVFQNATVENLYEMGSIMKPLAMAAALDAGVVSPTTTYHDTGTITLDTKKISNFDGKARGRVTMQEVLNQSLNVGMVFVEQKLGNTAFAKYMKAYGFGAKTNVELPNEAAGLVANLSSNRDVNYATAAFGQGIAVTPIQMATALAVLGNGGKLVSPHIVERIEYRVGITDQTDFAQSVQVLQPETSKTITDMLVTVVDKALLNGKAKMDRYTIAAKTGTAQMVNATTKEYDAHRYLHSFFGYFPAYQPKFLILLFQTDPKGAQYASATLTDPFMDLTKFLINYYNIPPDR